MLNRLRALYADLTSSTSAPSDSTTERSGDHSGGTGTGSTGVEDADPASTQGREASGSWHDLLDGEEVSKQEVQLELGLQPHEFLAWLVRDAGGRMWQADMVETTGWSKSTVSRYLDSLESSGIVERVTIGRRKLVAVPGRLPDAVSTTDRTSGDPPVGGWSPGTDEPA